MKFTRGNAAGHTTPTLTPTATLSLSGTAFPGASNPTSTLSVSGTSARGRPVRLLRRAVMALRVQFLVACIATSLFLSGICAALSYNNKKETSV